MKPAHDAALEKLLTKIDAQEEAPIAEAKQSLKCAWNDLVQRAGRADASRIMSSIMGCKASENPDEVEAAIRNYFAELEWQAANPDHWTTQQFLKAPSVKAIVKYVREALAHLELDAPDPGFEPVLASDAGSDGTLRMRVGRTRTKMIEEGALSKKFAARAYGRSKRSKKTMHLIPYAGQED